MTTDTGTEAAIVAKEAFYAYVASLPASIRDDVEQMAWANSWSVECYEAGKSNAARWEESLSCARMIADAPADYGLTA